MTDVVVIGGGASGMLAAAVAAERGLSVLLVEKNDSLGRKLRVTGKGRCNLTNNCSVREVLENIPTEPKFLHSAMSRLTPQDVMALFEKLGVRLKTERGNRVFPVSDNSADVVSALKKYGKKSGVTVRHDTVKEIRTQDGAVRSVLTENGTIDCRTVILCTGGLSYPSTGSTGDGLMMAEKLGHTIIAPEPSLVPLEAEPHLCSRMQGLTLKNVTITVLDGDGKVVFEEFGELLFTHFGLSGPLVLSASAHMKANTNKKYTVRIDLKPALSEKKLDARILRDFDKYTNRDFGNALGDLLNRLMIPVVVERSGIPADTKVHSVTRAQRKKLIRQLKEFSIRIRGPRPIAEAIITSGGIDVREINPKTMESKIVRGLYFAGEVMNVDAYTGGFNLQIAWATAYAAGTHADSTEDNMQPVPGKRTQDGKDDD